MEAGVGATNNPQSSIKITKASAAHSKFEASERPLLRAKIANFPIKFTWRCDGEHDEMRAQEGLAVGSLTLRVVPSLLLSMLSSPPKCVIRVRIPSIPTPGATAAPSGAWNPCPLSVT